MSLPIVLQTERSVLGETLRASLSERAHVYTLELDGQTLTFSVEAAKWLRDALDTLLAG
jgi:hypothetical protein